MNSDIKSHRLTESELNDNFTELVPVLSDKQVLVESERCLFCYDAPCIEACPTGIDIPNFIRKIHTGNSHGAAKEILSANILGGSCARVCPTETLCEQKCVRNLKEEAPVAIGRLQRYAVDHLDTEKPYPFTRKPDTGKHVAVVGAGPAGLACAHRLAREGHLVTIVEAEKKPGGLNEYGIAHYKLVDDYAQKEVDFVLQLGGIEVQYGTRLGDDVSLKELQQQYDAVFLGVGLGSSRSLGIEGEDLLGVEDAVEYISELRQAQQLDNLPVGRQVIVIGAGMTAIDIAVQSKKLGAEDVTIVYRRGEQDMGASDHEKELAKLNGVQFRFNAQPHHIVGNNGHATAIEFQKTSVNGDGQLVPVDEFLLLPCDVIFKAIGQQLDGSVNENLDSELSLAANGKVKVDENFSTSMKKVFAGGDCTEGEDLVVVAVDQGNQAAESIHKFLTQA